VGPITTHTNAIQQLHLHYNDITVIN